MNESGSHFLGRLIGFGLVLWLTLMLANGILSAFDTLIGHLS